MAKEGVIYCTTNLINGKKYIGLDSRNEPKYLGSGIIYKQALKKYGKENFKKQILASSNNIDILKELEIYYIDYYNAKESDLFYNIASGGIGGDLFTNHKDKELISKKKSNSMKKFNIVHGNHNIGKKYNRKIKNNPRGICIHCKKDFALNILSQFHGDHCYENPLIDKKVEKDRRSKSNSVKMKRDICKFCNESHGINVITRYHNDKCLKNKNLSEVEIKYLIKIRERKKRK